MPRGDLDWTEIIPGAYFPGQDVGIGVDYVRFLQRDPIYVDFLVTYFYYLPGQTDNPFYKIEFSVFGIDEDDYVAAGRLFALYPDASGQRVAHPINKLIDQDMVPDKEGRDHGARRDFEGLYYKGAYKKGQDQGQDNGLGPFDNLCR